MKVIKKVIHTCDVILNIFVHSKIVEINVQDLIRDNSPENATPKLKNFV